MPPGSFRTGPSGPPRLPGGQRRLVLLRVIVLGLLALLVARLWDLQVLASEHYQTLARNDFVRDVVLPATRGEILDRNGRVLVGNQASWSVLVDPGQLGSAEGRTLDRLASLLGMPRARIDRRLRVFTSSPFAIPVAEHVDTRVLFEIAEHPEEFPGVSTEPVAVRGYPDGTAAAQVLGYVGPVTADELRAPAYRGALPGDDVGQAGVEQAYDQVLRGHDGAAAAGDRRRAERRGRHPLPAVGRRPRAAARQHPRRHPAGPGRRRAAARRHRHRHLPGLPLRQPDGGGQDRHRQRHRPPAGRLVRLLRAHRRRPLRHRRVDRPGRLRRLGGRPGRQAGAGVPGEPPRRRGTVARVAEAGPGGTWLDGRGGATRRRWRRCARPTR
jgi:hypothetical protein